MIIKMLKRTKARRFKTRFQKIVAAYLAITLLFDAVFPTCAFALTGGPSQPEVQSFEPVSTSDMVDMFSGDFNYNIPLMDVDGYPLNIAYHGGVTMDQEASWVGLGWNINPGVINRNMRGVPDDFNGDQITKEYHMRNNWTTGATFSKSWELWENKLKTASLNLGGNVGVNFNNYNGFGFEFGLHPSLSLSKKTQGGKTSGSMNLGVNFASNSETGIDISPNLSFSHRVNSTETRESSLGLSIGTTFNSRAGLKQLTISTTASVNNYEKTGKYSETEEGKKEFEENKDAKDYDIFKAKSSFSSSGGTSFNFGSPTFTPNVEMPMYNFSFTGSYSYGPVVEGLWNQAGTISGYFNIQKLAQTNVKRNAYGYLYHEKAYADANAMMDVNREKDGPISKESKVLPVANATYDFFSVSGQGNSGSYRPYRGDYIYTKDPTVYSGSDGINLAVEFGAGTVTHLGGDIIYNGSSSTTGAWSSENDAIQYFNSAGGSKDQLYETSYFKEANEKAVESDPDYKNGTWDYSAVQMKLDDSKKWHIKATNDLQKNSGATQKIGKTVRTKRDRRNLNFSYLARVAAMSIGVEDYNNKSYDINTGVKNLGLYNNTNVDQHISEITTTGLGGSRYVYGIPAYNKTQKEVSFAVGDQQLTGVSGRNVVQDGAYVSYNHDDATTGNNLGIDEYFSSTKMPAYAHSYLLTSVLSTDYVDIDNEKGPSDGDLGTYTKFDYEKLPDFKWKTPVNDKNKWGTQFLASYNEGLMTDREDDKGSYLYGEKELYYLKQITTKNYIAIFETSPRKDGNGVTGEDGEVDNNVNNCQRKLDKIILYSKADYQANGSNALPIKVVHFKYSYRLCKGIPTNDGSVDVMPNTPNQGGKLTLEKIFFTYQNSDKGAFSPYTFTYNEFADFDKDGQKDNNESDFDYNIKGYDKWGNYKPDALKYLDIDNNAGTRNNVVENPYVDQDKSKTDAYSTAWTLKKINLPSGGEINIKLESDDYAYVQDKRAMQMFPIVGTVKTEGGNSTMDLSSAPSSMQIASSASGLDRNRKICFPLTPKSGGGYYNQKEDYFDENQLSSVTGADEKKVYIKALVSVIKGDGFEYVPCYADIIGFSFDNTAHVGIIELKPVTLKSHDGNGDKDVSPITKAALQFGRLHLAKKYNNDFAEPTQDASAWRSIWQGFLQVFANYKDLVLGPDISKFDSPDGYGKNIYTHLSYIRLFNPNFKKLGGGCRVKQIRLSDNWDSMVSAGAGTAFDYGQEYNYSTADGKSTGVAQYEPMVGGEENPFRQPIVSTVNKIMVPDEHFFVETPIGESLFPSPGVGYSKVEVKNLDRQGVTRTATGKVVHEFYTARDFPVLLDKTEADIKRENRIPINLFSIINLEQKQHLTATQGFYVEQNDMHGKPKAETIYQEGGSNAISSVRYNYLCEPINGTSFKLKNTVSVINKNGVVQDAEIGVSHEAVADFREETSETGSFGVMLNAEVIYIITPVPVLPIILPSYAHGSTQFRTATLTKTVQRFGLMDETVASDLGSMVKTKNLAYDAETGEVLATETQTNFNDKVYTLNYPAHWVYDKLGQAYKNLGYSGSLNLTNGETSITGLSMYVEGDELILASNNTLKKAWVLDVNKNNDGKIRVIDEMGNPVSGSYESKIVRSGRNNSPSAKLMSIVTLTDPRSSISSGNYQNILSAGATEYSDYYRTYCDCYNYNGTTSTGTSAIQTSNPYLLGTKNNWHPVRDYTYLTGRVQNITNNNTNIRKDGVFESFNPYYKLDNSGKWIMDKANWTYVSEVTEASPHGQEFENKDALERFSAAQYGYRQMYPTAVAANTKYRELGYDNFEDYQNLNCSDQHFKFTDYVNKISNAESHTGRYSIKVTNAAPVSMQKTVALCDVPKECTVDISVTSAGTVVISGGNAPFTVTYVKTAGTAQVALVNGDYKITGSGKIKFTVSDDKGCVITKEFSK